MMTTRLLPALLLLAFSTSPAAAGPTTFSGDGSLGDFTATLEFTPSGADGGTLKVTLTNNPTTSAGGKITAFAFNNPGNVITGVVAGGVFAASFQVIGGPPGGNFQDGIQTSPVPNFDIGASISDEWLGGGNPGQGIPAGSTETFEFLLSGTGVGALTESDFVNATAGGEHFLVRFRGFDNGGSDKVAGGEPGAGGIGGGGIGGGGQPGGSVEIPEPGSLLIALALCVIGLGGYGLSQWRRIFASPAIS